MFGWIVLFCSSIFLCISAFLFLFFFSCLAIFTVSALLSVDSSDKESMVSKMALVALYDRIYNALSQYH